ncbi:MAG: adenosylmethionine--8-amino-7-oxononanoate transaminase [Opitutales bacterium]
MPTATAAASSSPDALDAADRRFGWHPFTQMREYQDNPRLHLVRGEGSWLIDGEGKRYLDGNASVWTNVHGHNDPDLNRALREQLEQVAHVTLLGLNHPVATGLAEDLAGLTGGALPRCFYTDNGSNAIEVALKLSFQYWQLVGQEAKRGVISMDGAYHGDTFGTMAVGERSEFHRRFNPWLFAAQTFPAPVHSECAGQVARSDASASLAALKAMLERDAATTACVILEPVVQGAAGMVQQPAGFVKAVAALCRQHGVHLILDEVFTGFGRLGALTASEREGVVPDFLCLAKGLAAGYLPLAATLTSEQIYASFLGKFSEGKTFFHGHTFSGNPLACAVARASLRKLKPMLASGQVAERATLLGREMQAAFEGHAHVRTFRQLGLTGSVEFKPASADRWPTDTRAGFQVALAARRHGLVIRPLGDSILFVPPISIQADEVKHLVRAVRLAMDEVLPNLK